MSSGRLMKVRKILKIEKLALKSGPITANKINLLSHLEFISLRQRCQDTNQKKTYIGEC